MNKNKKLALKLILVLLSIAVFSVFLAGCAAGPRFPKVTETGVVVQIIGKGAPMQNVPLAVRITNNSQDFISDVKVKLVSVDGKTDLSPFKLWMGKREVDIKEIAKTDVINSGKSATLTYTLASYSYIESKAYPVTVEVSYKDSNGKVHTITKNGIIDIVPPNKFYKAVRDTIELFHKVIPNYGWDIVIFTLLLSLLLHPLTHKQFKSTAGMSKLQPEIKKIQEKYKGDPQKANQEVMKLYKENNVSMTGGCLIALIQWPIFLVLFGALMNYAPFNTEGFLWLKNLNTPDPYYILPILVFISMYYQTKTSQMPGQQQDPTTKMMMYFMPLFLAVWAIKWSPSLIIYWITYSFAQAAQQAYIIRILSREMETVPPKTGTALPKSNVVESKVEKTTKKNYKSPAKKKEKNKKRK